MIGNKLSLLAQIKNKGYTYKKATLCGAALFSSLLNFK